MRLMMLVPLLLVCLLVAAVVTVLLTRRSSTLDGDGLLAARIEDLARTHREVDEGGLAEAVIHRVLEAKRSGASGSWAALPDDVLELCFAHRDDSPELSVILTDTILQQRRKQLG